MDPFGGLSDENGAQIRKYLRFFAQKKDGILRSIQNEFADSKADKLHEDVYTRDDVEDFCDFLATSVRVRIVVPLYDFFALSIQNVKLPSLRAQTTEQRQS